METAPVALVQGAGIMQTLLPFTPTIRLKFLWAAAATLVVPVPEQGPVQAVGVVTVLLITGKVQVLVVLVAVMLARLGGLEAEEAAARPPLL